MPWKTTHEADPDNDTVRVVSHFSPGRLGRLLGLRPATATVEFHCHDGRWRRGNGAAVRPLMAQHLAALCRRARNHKKR